MTTPHWCTEATPTQTARVPRVVAGDVVEERLGLVVVAVGPERVALLVGVALAILRLHARVAFILAVERLLVCVANNRNRTRSDERHA